MSVTGGYARGEGPGVITPDGCAVELYSLLPRGHVEADVIASVAAEGATVLELGAGAGRVTSCLLDRGLDVVAVDESPEMLSRIRSATTVQSRIEELALDRQFDVVVLGSHLVNVPDADAARALLATCARHVAADGEVLVERRAPEWFDNVGPMDVQRDGIGYTLSDVAHDGPDRVTATIRYRVGARSWAQTFTTSRVTDERLRKLLRSVGLELIGFADDERTWARASR